MTPKLMDCENCTDHKMIEEKVNEALHEVKLKLPSWMFIALGGIFIGCFMMVSNTTYINRDKITALSKDIAIMQNQLTGIHSLLSKLETAPSAETIQKIVRDEMNEMRIWHVEEYHTSSGSHRRNTVTK